MTSPARPRIPTHSRALRLVADALIEDEIRIGRPITISRLAEYLASDLRLDPITICPYNRRQMRRLARRYLDARPDLDPVLQGRTLHYRPKEHRA